MAFIDKFLKIGCSGCLLVFGVLMLIQFIGFLKFSSVKDSKAETTWFEVTTDKGKARLHLGMPKDSVILLVGDPEESSAHSIGNTVYERIGYKTKGSETPNLTFEFESGKLKEFNQY